MTPRPRPVGLTLGDAAGISLEIVAAVLASDERPLAVYGLASLFELAAGDRAAPRFDQVLSLSAFRELEQAPAGHTLIDLSEALPAEAAAAITALDRVPFGEPFAPFAHLQGVALEAAIDDAMAGRLAAICTAPLTKALFRLAGRPATGHTEILADRSGAPHHVMMLAGDRLRVALVTTHIPLSEVSARLSAEAIAATIATTAADLRQRFGIARPRIAVAALNPHAGEQGTMGNEEQTIILPALALASAPDLVLSGPHPADTLFARFARAPEPPYDAVVCMYHDQALIPLKLMHFGRSANITLGLPFVRTSVDHGTAYDIAGEGLADADSLRYALELARRLAGTNG